MAAANILLVDDHSSVYDLPDRSAIRLFFYLLSICNEDDDGYCVKKSKIDLTGDTGLPVLIESGLVQEDNGYLWLSDDAGVLYANQQNPLATELSALMPYIEQMQRSKSARSKNQVRKEQVDKCILLLTHPKKHLQKTPDIINVYKGAYALIMEEEHRELTQKEAGQFKALSRLYNPVTAAKMCIQYLLKEQRFPSIGILLTNKDEIYHTLVKSSNKPDTNATGSF